MNIQEFVKRQKEFIGKTVIFHIKWNEDGWMTEKISRKIVAEEEYRVPDGELFEVVEVEIQEEQK